MKENLILRISPAEVLKKHVSQIHNFIHLFVSLQVHYKSKETDRPVRRCHQHKWKQISYSSSRSRYCLPYNAPSLSESGCKVLTWEGLLDTTRSHFQFTLLTFGHIWRRSKVQGGSGHPPVRIPPDTTRSCRHEPEVTSGCVWKSFGMVARPPEDWAWPQVYYYGAVPPSMDLIIHRFLYSWEVLEWIPQWVLRAYCPNMQQMECDWYWLGH